MQNSVKSDTLKVSQITEFLGEIEEVNSGETRTQTLAGLHKGLQILFQEQDRK